jgi:hypothetical protein
MDSKKVQFNEVGQPTSKPSGFFDNPQTGISQGVMLTVMRRGQLIAAFDTGALSIDDLDIRFGATQLVPHKAATDK